MIDIQQTVERLKAHLEALTLRIGERSVRFPANIQKTAEYIQSFYQENAVAVHYEPFSYQDLTVANVVAELSSGLKPSKHFLLGAHYDSVAGTVGADDNASAIAVQLETARHLKALMSREEIGLAVKFVSFALEEPPVYGTPFMGSRVYARKARQAQERLDGMICLEMVGYTCSDPGCQRYPFPLMFLGYPKAGNFIGLVGNLGSRALARSLFKTFRQNRQLPVVKLTVPFNGRLVPAVRLSDHASFWDQGFQAVMITDSAFYRNPHYHLPSDTMSKLDYRFMAELVESLLIFFRSEGR
ncbi:MAG: M28 family peptidase [Desulfobacterales bacterium]|nr:MAG: M28 family peptidase [Desulfobacterales bacterium]